MEERVTHLSFGSRLSNRNIKLVQGKHERSALLCKGPFPRSYSETSFSLSQLHILTWPPGKHPAFQPLPPRRSPDYFTLSSQPTQARLHPACFPICQIRSALTCHRYLTSYGRPHSCYAEALTLRLGYSGSTSAGFGGDRSSLNPPG